jgi:hypothetical protein
MTYPNPVNPYSLDGDIRREGREWGEEELDHYFRAPAKIELIDGKRFWRQEDRLMLVALLLENLGVDAVVRFGDPKIWRAAVAALPE